MASTDASRRVLALNFRTTEAHPIGPGFETFEHITLGEKDRTRRARCMQHWNSNGELAKICSVFGEKRIRLEPAIDIYGKAGGRGTSRSNDSGKQTPLYTKDTELKVRKSSNGRVRLQMAMATAVDVETMAGELRMGQSAWASLSPLESAAALDECAQALEAGSETIIAALVQDTGRSAESALELRAVMGALKRWAKNGPGILKDASPDMRASAASLIGVAQQVHPYALVGIISPWNFLFFAMIDAIPALMAGSGIDQAFR